MSTQLICIITVHTDYNNYILMMRGRYIIPAYIIIHLSYSYLD